MAGDGHRDWHHKPSSQLPPIAESGYRRVQTAKNCILVVFMMASRWWDQLREDPSVSTSGPQLRRRHHRAAP